VTVRTQPIGEALFRDLGDYMATLEALQQVKLAAVSSGRIQQRLVREGQLVQRGQVLLRLRERERSADVAQAQADVARRQAELAEGAAKLTRDKSNFERYIYLNTQGASSAQELDSYRTQYLAQQASVRASQDSVKAGRAALEAARSRLSDKTVSAPISGQLSDLRVKEGDVVKEGDPFTSIVRNDRLLTRIAIPAVDASRIRIGLPVWLLDPSNGKELARGSISFVDPDVNPTTQGVLAKAEFLNSNGALRSGLRVRTQVGFAAREQLAVPFSAVSQTAGQSFVYVQGVARDLPAEVRARSKGIKDQDPVAVKRPVRLGPLQGNCYPVLDGLLRGDRLITSNLLSLRNGTAVKPRPTRRQARVCS
jgi:RND family efflux transporter MFP subunit